MCVELDSVQLLTVVLSGDNRLLTRLRHDDLLPLGSRIRTRLILEGGTAKELADCLRHVMESAGNGRLMTDELVKTLSEHSAGNHRVLMATASELLVRGAEKEVEKLDEKLFLTVFDPGPKRGGRS